VWERQRWQVDAIACRGGLNVDDGRISALLEDKRRRPFPSGFEGHQVGYMRDELGGRSHDEQAMFEKNLKPVTPHGDLSGFLFRLLRRGTILQAIAGGAQEHPDTENAPKAYWASKGQMHSISSRCAKEIIPENL
jgi:hypothetical protein